MRKILIFDTTLRDGLKFPGTILSTDEKVRLAKQLARLQVDVLEIGFPAASQEQFEAAERIAREVQGPILAVLARATNPRDFEIAWKAVQDRPRSAYSHVCAGVARIPGPFSEKERSRDRCACCIRHPQCESSTPRTWNSP